MLKVVPVTAVTAPDTLKVVGVTPITDTVSPTWMVCVAMVVKVTTPAAQLAVET